MAKAKCGYCGKRAAKRFCPTLDKLICPVCCGENRLKNIDCDKGCRYLDNELYQQKVRKEKELSLLLENVPHSEHNDIFKNNVAASIAYNFELFFADTYINDQFNLTDNKVKETLTVLYYVVFKEQKSVPDAFLSEVAKLYNKLKDEYEEELIGQVILRIIISIKKMTGGRFGAYGYLNYLKNNLHPSYIEDPDTQIMELKDGRKYNYADLNMLKQR
jgi:hypothetical protein